MKKLYSSNVPLVSFDLNFSLSNRFNSINEAALFYNTRSSSISSVLNRQSRMFMENVYLFTEKEVEDKIYIEYFHNIETKKKDKLKFEELLKSIPSKRELRKNKIIGFSPSLMICEIFDCIQDASEKLEANKGGFIALLILNHFQTRFLDIIFFHTLKKTLIH